MILIAFIIDQIRSRHDRFRQPAMNRSITEPQRSPSVSRHLSINGPDSNTTNTFHSVQVIDDDGNNHASAATALIPPRRAVDGRLVTFAHAAVEAGAQRAVLVADLHVLIL